MNRRMTLALTGMTLLGLTIAAFPQVSFARSDPWIGTWQLNLAKSKYSPGPPPKSQTVYTEAEGQNHKLTVVGINAAGNPIKGTRTWIYDGMPRAEPSLLNADASAYTRIDAYTVSISHTKAGKLVGTETVVISSDGKIITVTNTGTNANGQQFSDIRVYDKQ
jgi:hypothetical protein